MLYIEKRHGEYSLYRRRTQRNVVWYVRFWDSQERRYSLCRSTGVHVTGKRGRILTAHDVARELLNQIRENGQRVSFLEYINNFWQDDGPYAKEFRVVKGRTLSANYLKSNREVLRLYVNTFNPFKDLFMDQLKNGHFRDWIVWAKERGVSGIRINKVLQAIRVSIRSALDRGDIDHDPLEFVRKVVEKKREKGILSKTEIAALLSLAYEKPVDRLAIMLGLLCGMRIGEVRGLLWSDIKEGYITINHNWQDLEGLKSPKCQSYRNVPVPMPVQAALAELNKDQFTEGLVMKSPIIPDKPISLSYFRHAFEQALQRIGVSKTEQRKRNITFHSLRHNYITLGRLAGISDIEIQALAGHKSAVMMERYSHPKQIIDCKSAGEKLELALKIDTPM